VLAGLARKVVSVAARQVFEAWLLHRVLESHVHVQQPLSFEIDTRPRLDGLLFLEVPPLFKDLLALKIFDGRELIAIVLVATEGVKSHLFAEAFVVLLLDDFENRLNLGASVHFFIVNAHNRVEDGPHHFRIIHLSLVISDVQAENNLVELGVLDSDSLVAQRRRQVSQKSRQRSCRHVQITHRVVLSPYVLKRLDVLLL